MKKVLLILLFIFCSLVAQGRKSESFLTDTRDGQTYRIVRIGNQTWMAENLNYETGNSWCYNNDNLNCDKYGRLYDWNTAVSACPSGWRLSSHQDWVDLGQAVGGKRVVYDETDTIIFWDGAGNKLRSRMGWKENGNGTDDYEFSALPGGNRNVDGNFGGVSRYGYWWTATEYDSSNAYSRYMSYGNYGLYERNLYDDSSIKTNGYSIRCVQKNSNLR